MTIDLASEFTAAIAARATSREYGEGSVLTLPWTLGDGESVSIYVERLADDLFLLSDRGLAADALGLAGVDVDTKAVRRSWDAISRVSQLVPPVMSEISPYEIAGTSSRDGLGTAMTRLGETMLRVDSLRVLGRRSGLSFKDRAIRSAHEHDLAVITNARLQNRWGAERRVSFRVEGRSWAFVQAISGIDGVTGVDHARVVFGDATESHRERKVSLVSSSARVQAWQLEALQDVSHVVDESNQNQFFDSLAS